MDDAAVYISQTAGRVSSMTARAAGQAPAGRHAMKLARSIFVLAIATCIAAPAAAATEPQRRGPVLEVIRHKLSRYPEHPRFEARGPISVSSIASSVWSGPGPAATYDNGPRPKPHWTEPVFSDTWDQLRSEQVVWVDRDAEPRDQRR